MVGELHIPIVDPQTSVAASSMNETQPSDAETLIFFSWLSTVDSVEGEMARGAEDSEIRKHKMHLALDDMEVDDDQYCTKKEKSENKTGIHHKGQRG